MFSSKNLNLDSFSVLSTPAKKTNVTNIDKDNFHGLDNKSKDFRFTEHNCQNSENNHQQNNEASNYILINSSTMDNNSKSDNLTCSQQSKEIKLNDYKNASIALSIEEDSEFVENKKNNSLIAASPRVESQTATNDDEIDKNKTTISEDDSIYKRYDLSPSQSSISCSSTKSSMNLKRKLSSNNDKNNNDIQIDKICSPDQNQIELRFLVRRREAGALIGKKGSNIKRLRETFKLSIFSIPDTGNGPERVVCIVTNDKCLDSILNDLTQLMLEKSPENDEQIEMKLLIHSSHAGSLIGIGGQSIKKLRNDSKAAIKIYEMCCPLSNERVCAIKAKPPVVVNTIKLIQNILDENPIKGTIKPYDALHFDLNLLDKYGGYLPDEPASIDLMHSHHYQNNHNSNPYNEIQNRHHAYHPLAFNHRHHNNHHHHHHNQQNNLHRQHLQNVALAAAAAYQTTKQHYPIWRTVGSETCQPIDMHQIDDHQLYQHESTISTNQSPLPATTATSSTTKIDLDSTVRPTTIASEVESELEPSNNTFSAQCEKTFANQQTHVNSINNDSENNANQNCKQQITSNEQASSANINNKPTSYVSASLLTNNPITTIALATPPTFRGTNRYHPYNNHLQNSNKISTQFNGIRLNNSYPMINNNNGSFYRNSNINLRRQNQFIPQQQTAINTIRQQHQQLNNCFLNNQLNVDNFNYQQQQQLHQHQQRLQQQEYFAQLPTMNFPQANLMDACHRHNSTSRSCLCMLLPIMPDSHLSNGSNLSTANSILGGPGGALNQLIRQQQPPSFVHLACHKNYNNPPQEQVARNFRANNETFKKKL